MTTETFFHDYSKALLSYSAEEIAAFYQVPLSVYSDEGVIQVSKMEEVTGFWKKGIEPYKAQNISKSVPQILSEEKLSKTISICKVLWKNYDASDGEVAQETNFYILTESKEGLKINGLILISK